MIIMTIAIGIMYMMFLRETPTGGILKKVLL